MGEAAATTTETEAAININVLSDKELYNILNSIPIVELMNAELICKRWQFIHEIVCRNKTQLTLYVPSCRFNLKHIPEVLHWSNETFATKFEDYALPIHSGVLTRQSCELLVEKFNPKSLNLFGVRLSIRDFAFLLHHWPNLEQLTLTYGPAMRTGWSSFDWEYFWDVVETLSQLKHLALPYNCELDLLYRNVMARLNTLMINIGFDFNGAKITKLFDNIRPKLHSLTMTDVYHDVNLRQFQFEDVPSANYFNLENKFKAIIQEKPRTFSQLTHLGWHFRVNSGIDKKLMRFICQRFTSLTHLDANIDCYMTLDGLVPILLEMKHLTSLRISPQQRTNVEFEDEDSEYEQSDVEEGAQPEQPNQPDTRMRSSMFFQDLSEENYRQKLSVKLEGIKQLYLVDIDFQLAFFDYLHCAMPNVELIAFENCEFPLVTAAVRQKKRALLQALRKFSKLKKIYRNNSLLCTLADFDLSKGEEVARAEAKLKELLKRRRKLRHFQGVHDPNNVVALQELYEHGEDMEVVLGQGFEAPEMPDIDDEGELDHFDFNYDFSPDIYDPDMEGLDEEGDDEE